MWRAESVWLGKPVLVRGRGNTSAGKSGMESSSTKIMSATFSVNAAPPGEIIEPFVKSLVYFWLGW